MLAAVVMNFIDLSFYLQLLSVKLFTATTTRKHAMFKRNGNRLYQQQCRFAINWNQQQQVYC